MNSSDSKFKIGRINFFLIIAFAACSKLLKFSFIVGSSRCFFSLINITSPLVTYIGGLPFGVGLLLLNSAVSFKSSALFCGLLASNGLPNFFAGLYLRSTSRLLKTALPVLFILLFWYVTWGTIAMFYALLWLIPLAINYFKIESIYGKTLAATFVAHGAGSIIWLYFANIMPIQWFALIPVALCERVFLAILMGMAYNLWQCLLKQYSLYQNTNCKANLQLEGTSL